MIAEVILNSNVKQLNRVFDYEIPKEIISKVEVGSLVFVPFSNRKELEEGTIIKIKETSLYNVKKIVSINEKSYISKEKIDLAKWMSKRYFCNLSECIKLMLPPGTTTKMLENRIKEKMAHFIYLKKDEQEIEDEIKNKKIKSEKQIRALKFLMENDGILTGDLEAFADISRAVINTLKKNGYIEIIEKQIERNPLIDKNIERTNKLKLTKEQQKAYDTICESIEDMLFTEFLIYGVTGSRENRNILTIN